MQLKQFKSYDIMSVEKEMHENREKDDTENTGERSYHILIAHIELLISDVKILFFYYYTGLINENEINSLTNYIKRILKNKAHDVKVTNRLESHPCVITVQDMAAARHFIRTKSHAFDDQMRYSLLQPRLEINPNHPLIKTLLKLKSSDEEIAKRLIDQVNLQKMESRLALFWYYLIF